MGKKKINILFLFMLLNVHVHSQELFTKELQWQGKNELVSKLYEGMKSFVNDTTPVAVEYNKRNFFEMNLSDLSNRIFKRKKIDKQLTSQKQIKQKEIKNYLDSNFVVVNDSVIGFGFKNQNQIIEWGKSFGIFAFVQSEKFCIKSNKIIILTVDVCSGIPCLSIYIFIKKSEQWQLITGSSTRLKGQIIISAHDDEEKIIFKMKSGRIENPAFEQIGELPFEVLLQ
jgi:hypothetical protein